MILAILRTKLVAAGDEFEMVTYGNHDWSDCRGRTGFYLGGIHEVVASTSHPFLLRLARNSGDHWHTISTQKNTRIRTAELGAPEMSRGFASHECIVPKQLRSSKTLSLWPYDLKMFEGWIHDDIEEPF